MQLTDFQIAHTNLLLDSYYSTVGDLLMPDAGSPDANARLVWSADFVLVSHGTQEDPIFNFANKSALDLWELDWETFTRMPSRKSAEPVHRDLRAQMLEQTKKLGYNPNYSGIRISSSGRRFKIEEAIVWTVFDQQGIWKGQAATFNKWTFL